MPRPSAEIPCLQYISKFQVAMQVYSHGNMYASMFVMPTALAALYVVAIFGSTAPPCDNPSATVSSILENVKVLRSHMLGYTHAV